MSARRLSKGAMGVMILGFGLVLALASAGAASAQGPKPAEVADYLGTWILSVDFQGNPAELTLEIVERQGEVKAALRSALSPEPSLIDQIAKSDAGLELAYTADFGGTSMRIRLKAALADGKMAGTFGDEGGTFSAPFTGARAAEPAGIVESALQGSGDAAVPQQRRGRRGMMSSQAQLALGDKKVRILFGDLKTGTPDYDSFVKMAEGDVFEYASSRCMKLFTDLDLQFGETKVATANIAPDYPGVYGLWLKKTSNGGWHLVFNQEGDVWGTMHDPAKDVVEVPLRVDKLTTPVEQLEVTLVPSEDQRGGVLRIAWANVAFVAPFTTQ